MSLKFFKNVSFRSPMSPSSSNSWWWIIKTACRDLNTICRTCNPRWSFRMSIQGSWVHLITRQLLHPLKIEFSQSLAKKLHGQRLETSKRTKNVSLAWQVQQGRLCLWLQISSANKAKWICRSMAGTRLCRSQCPQYSSPQYSPKLNLRL